jgi:glycosyltransferase involved in cell wall biosynthesis
MNDHKVAAVIPCYNVSRACIDVIRRTNDQVDRVIAVDDGSTDDTLQALRETGCEIVQLPVNQGKGVALRAGFEAALAGECDYIVTLDGDGQHLPEEIAGLLERALRSGSDAVIGIRQVSRMPLRSQFGNLWTRWFYRAQTGKPLPDTQSGYRVFKASAVRQLLEQVHWARFDTEMDMLFKANRAGMRVTTAPISTVYIDENRLTKFRTLTDSMRVFFVVVRYAAAGVSAAVLEFVLFSGLMLLLTQRYGWALLISRAAALLTHYLVTRFFAFRLQRRIAPAELLKYALVAAINLAASYGMLHLLIAVLGWNAILAKAVSQSILFLVTFVLLQRFTFRVRLA